MSQPESPNELLEQIRADIISNNVCPDLAQEATQLVMGHGNPSARIVFIGEAPGKNEDLQGIPFVGAAGKLLDEMLAENSIQRSDVYITNIVKYRPPNNRDPLPEEKKAFWPYLLRELKVIGPAVIVTLGRHSMEYFLPDKQISIVHGKPFKANLGKLNGEEISLVIVPLYHPAAALYNGGLRTTLFEDFKIITNYIN
jgi:uracil-DNA glycosylase